MSLVFFFNDTATTEIYTLSLHDALPILTGRQGHCQLELMPGHFGNSITGQPARSLCVQSEVCRCQPLNLALCVGRLSRIVLAHGTTEQVGPGSRLSGRKPNVLSK